MMAEEDFPRGKLKQALKSHESETKEEKTSFDKSKKTGVKEFSRKRQFADESPFREAKRIKWESNFTPLESPLQNETLCTNLTVLACVRQAYDYNISLSIPGSHIASLPITNISEAYSKKLKELAHQKDDDENPSEDFSPAEDFFKPGLLIPVFVSEISENNKGKKMVTTTCDPARINSNLSIKTLQDGMMLLGSISSVEDHGYRIDLGVRGLQAFLKASDAERYIDKYQNGEQLSVGMPLRCVLNLKGKSEEEIKATRVVNVSIDPQAVCNAKIPKTANLNAILPGMKTDVVVESSTEQGLTVKVFGFQGIIHCSHLPRTAFSYNDGSELTAVILYVHPESKVIHLTALPHIMDFEGGPLELFGDLKLGDKMKGTIQRVVRKKGIFLQLSGSHKAFAAMSQLTDESAKPDITKYKRGEETDCRVMGFNFIEGLALVSLKKSILKQKIITVNDLKVGDLVKGTITEVQSNGVTVMLSRKIFSFISCMHLADVPIKHPEKKFEEGMKIKCRVVRVDTDKAKVILTHKKSLLESEFPLIKDYSDLRPDMQLEGVISFIGEKALHVKFFNNVQGYVLCRDMSTEKVEDPSALFYLGQVVRCRVVFYNAEERKLRLSFNLVAPNPEKKATAEEKEVKQPPSNGMIFQAKIMRVEKEAFRVSLLHDKTQFLLPFCHLSDYHELQEARRLNLKPGHELKEVLFFSSRLGGIVTMKESLLQAASEKKFAKTFEDLETGMLLPGVVKNHQDYGIFVELAGGFIGLCPLKTLAEMQPGNLQDLLPPGQTVIIRISKVDKEKNRFLGSLRKGECYEGGLESTLKYLHTYLSSRSQIMESLHEEDTELAPYSKVHLGSIIQVKVTSSHKKGILCDVQPGMKALATHKHFGNVEPVVGRKYEAIVLCVDPLAPCLEVSLDSKLIKAKKNRKDDDKNKVKPGQTIKADLQLIKTDYMLMSLRGHGAGAFVFVPTKQIINDVYGSPCYKEGMYSEVVIKDVKKDLIVGVLKMNDPESNEKNKLFQKSQIHDVEIGSVIDAKVKSVLEMQMNIVTCNSGIKGRVHVTEASDTPVEGKHPLHHYQPNNTVKVKVIGLRDMKTQRYLPISHPKAKQSLLECSLKESKMDVTKEEDLLSTSLSVSIEDEVYVYILQVAKQKVWVQVSPHHQGWIDLFHLSNDVNVINNVTQHFKVGRAFKAQVIGSDSNSKLILSLTGPAKAVKVGSEVNVKVTGIKPEECLSVRLPGGQLGKIKEKPLVKDYLGQFIHCRVDKIVDSQNFELCTIGDRQGEELVKENLPKSSTSLLEKSRKRKKAKKTQVDEQQDSGVDTSKMSSDSETDKQVPGKKSKGKSTLSIEGFSWTGDLNAQGEDKALSEDDDDGDDDDAAINASSKTRKRRKRDEEQAIQEHERHQLEGDTELQTPSDFERMVLQSPNSSIIWLRYMAFHMELGEIEKARAVAEKALSTIAFREEQEKKNIWLAYLNLETMYGNSDDVKKVLERAVAYNEPVEIYLKMCDIYVGAHKMDDAEQLYHIITRKFKKDKSVWRAYSQFLYKAGRLSVARNLLQRCLTALDKKDHVEVISKFAILEFTHGDAERGRTMFENLIASYPGRTDIWSVYIDMVTKAGDVDGARQLLERAIKQKLNTKKLSFLVQKFIKFEETYGSEEKIEKVKDLAVSLFET